MRTVEPAAGGAAGRRNPRDIHFGDAQRHVGYLVRRAQVWIFQDLIETFAQFDIRPAQFSVLLVISHNPGLTQAEIAEALGIEPARLVLLLDKLERQKLAKRQPSPADRRMRNLFVTPKGEKLLERLLVLAEEHERRVVERLGGRAAKEQLFRILSGFLPG